MTDDDTTSPPDLQPSDALVIFGATGDLARKKLHPALYHLIAARHTADAPGMATETVPPGAPPPRVALGSGG